MYESHSGQVFSVMSGRVDSTKLAERVESVDRRIDGWQGNFWKHH